MNSFQASNLSLLFDAEGFHIVPRGGRALQLSYPVLLTGEGSTGSRAEVEAVSADTFPDGAFCVRAEARYAARPDTGFALELRGAEDTPVVRFRYVFRGAGHFQKRDGCDALSYLSLPLDGGETLTEVRFSEFYEFYHSFMPVETPAFRSEGAAMGPMLCASSARGSVLLAYEHGSQYPDRFLEFRRTAEGVSLDAHKANYLSGEPVDGYTTIWLQAASVPGGMDALRRAYRGFQLRRATPNLESRRPYVFYNSWAFQERNRWWNGKPYLDSMNEKHMLAEIDAAHRLGVDVFVMDTGWYEKTGDWQVSRKRFPHGIERIRERLNGYGMKLGLWFNPTAAAVSSRMAAKNGANETELYGKKLAPTEIWETEESRFYCLVSDYWKDFADELIRICREWGVTYFKWDAIGQYACDAAGHDHGGADAPMEERRANYAFKQVQYMSRIIDRVCAACPEAIVDFDVTENGRSMGLAFLASGKYFLINNGAYNHSFDIPTDGKSNTNLFFYPGHARTWVCRTPLVYDRWIPSVLFLTHYLPDGPVNLQRANAASMMLGQNGVWGDLLSLSEEELDYFGGLTALYKRVRDDVTEAYPHTEGDTSSAFETHEKLSERTGKGVVCLFATAAGEYVYRTHVPANGDVRVEGPACVRVEPDGCLTVTLRAEGRDSAIVFVL